MDAPGAGVGAVSQRRQLRNGAGTERGRTRYRLSVAASLVQRLRVSDPVGIPRAVDERNVLSIAILKAPERTDDLSSTGSASCCVCGHVLFSTRMDSRKQYFIWQ